MIGLSDLGLIPPVRFIHNRGFYSSIGNRCFVNSIPRYSRETEWRSGADLAAAIAHAARVDFRRNDLRGGGIGGSGTGKQVDQRGDPRPRKVASSACFWRRAVHAKGLCFN